MAGSTSMVGGMVRVDPVYTPAHLRGRRYALYQRIGYVPIANFTGYDFADDTPEAT